MRILIAVDDSEFCLEATNRLIAEVRSNGTEVRLLHVLESFPVALAEAMGGKNVPDFTAARLRLRAEAETFLRLATDKLRSAGFEASYFLEEGDPREIILDYAEHWAADSIVVGSHVRKGINRFLMGSVSEAVARYARCSVQIIRIRSDH